MAAGGPVVFYDLASVPLPRPFDIVWCRWPFEDSAGGFKERPALVRAVFVDPDDPSRGAVEAVYGSSKIAKRPRSSFVIQSVIDLNFAGLFQATRFDWDRTLRLPWGPAHFAMLPGRSTPKTGALTNNQIVRLKLWAARNGRKDVPAP